MPLDILERKQAAAALVPRRRIQDVAGVMALLEIADGDARFVGPDVTHVELERVALELLACTGPGAYLPPILHKLCVGYLMARGLRVVA